jgi:nitrogen PTS system EIIA component
VATLFTMVSPTVRAHLHLLSRLTFGLRRPEFQQPVAAQASREVLLAAARAVDHSAKPA